MCGKTVGHAVRSFHSRYLFRVVAALLGVVLVVDYIRLKTGSNLRNIRFGEYAINLSEKDSLSEVKGFQYDDNTSSANGSVLCWVETGPQNHESRARHVKKTWGKRCTKLLFMSTEADEDLGTIALEGLEEGRDWLWAKTKASLQYIWQNHKDDADWFFKADDDTYVIMENLHYLLKEYDPRMPHYLGLRIQYKTIKPTVNFGGSGYALTREALRLFIEDALPDENKCNQSHGGDEDTQLGICMANVGVEPADTRDSLGRHRFLHQTPGYHFGWQYGKWDELAEPEEYGLTCCSDRLVSFHSLQTETMYVLEFMVYNLTLYDSTHMSHRS